MAAAMRASESIATYAAPVAISTKAAQLEMIVPSLLGLVTPHLQSIVSHAVNFADQKISPKAAAAAKAAADESMETGEFGAAVLESLQGGRNEGGFGFGEPAPRGAVSKPGKASQSHVDAILQIAGKKKDKKD